MKRVVWVALGLAVAGALLIVADEGERDEDPTELTVESTNDATKPIVDEAYRFELRWPGRGWKLLGPEDVMRFAPDGLAGAVHSSGLVGVVVVESAPDADLDDLTDRLIGQISGTDIRVESRERTTFAGKEAIRYIVTATIGGSATRHVNHVFLHEDHAYQVLGVGPQSAVSPSCRELAPLFDAFRLTEGEVTGGVRLPVVTTSEGVGWRISSGVFESAVAGIRIKPAAAWRLRAGEELTQVPAGAEVGLEHYGPDIHLVLISERAPSPEHLTAYIESIRAGFGEARGTPLTVSFAGEPLELVRITSNDRGRPLEYLNGVHVRNGRMTHLLAWYMAGERERAEQALREGIASISIMEPHETNALRLALAKRPDMQVAVGADYSLRNGTYRNFGQGWRWIKPSEGMWRITTGEAARKAHPDAELSFIEVTHDLNGVVLAEDTTTSAERFHELAVQRYAGKRSKTREYGDALVTDVRKPGSRFGYRIATKVQNGHGLQLELRADQEVLDAHGDLLDSAIAGLELDPGVKLVSIHDGEYRDHRFGFAIRPPSNYEFAEKLTDEMTQFATFPSWTHGDASYVGVVALYWALTTTDDQPMIDYLEQALRDAMGNLVRGRATRSDATLGGFPARRLQWPGVDAYIVYRNRLVYMWHSVGGAGDPSAFRLLD